MKMTKKLIETNIAKIAADSVMLDALIQETGLGCLNHVQEHGDVTLVNRLYSSLGRGHRKAALAEWLMQFGKVSANADSKTKKELPFLYDKAKTTNLVGAAETPWFEFKPEQTPDQLCDIAKLVAAIIAKASKAQTVSHPEALAALKVLAADMATAKPDTVLATAESDPLSE